MAAHARANRARLRRRSDRVDRHAVRLGPARAKTRSAPADDRGRPLPIATGFRCSACRGLSIGRGACGDRMDADVARHNAFPGVHG